MTAGPYDDDDLDAAVAAGVLSAEAAAGLRDFTARRRSTSTSSSADEENFRLLSGFNDIFVSIATVLILVAIDWLGRRIAPALGDAAVVAVSWGLAEYFTRRRRMALPSIVLLLSFAGGVFAVGLDLLGPATLVAANWAPQIGFGVSAGSAALAAYVHWRRFMVPITVAAGAGAAVGMVVSLIGALVPAMRGFMMPLLFLGGLAVFALAIGWDIGDRARTTRRADVAFWLHLSSAPLIVHPAFVMLGLLNRGEANAGRALVAVAIYFLLALVALAIDRRALLVSALFYVLYAMSVLFRLAGSPATSFALTALVIGSALLLLSAFWHRARAVVVGWLPGTIRARMPVV